MNIYQILVKDFFKDFVKGNWYIYKTLQRKVCSRKFNSFSALVLAADAVSVLLCYYNFPRNSVPNTSWIRKYTVYRCSVRDGEGRPLQILKKILNCKAKRKHKHILHSNSTHNSLSRKWNFDFKESKRAIYNDKKKLLRNVKGWMRGRRRISGNTYVCFKQEAIKIHIQRIKQNIWKVPEERYQTHIGVRHKRWTVIETDL